MRSRRPRSVPRLEGSRCIADLECPPISFGVRRSAAVERDDPEEKQFVGLVEQTIAPFWIEKLKVGLPGPVEIVGDREEPKDLLDFSDGGLRVPTEAKQPEPERFRSSREFIGTVADRPGPDGVVVVHPGSIAQQRESRNVGGQANCRGELAGRLVELVGGDGVLALANFLFNLGP